MDEEETSEQVIINAMENKFILFRFEPFYKNWKKLKWFKSHTDKFPIVRSLVGHTIDILVTEINCE